MRERSRAWMVYIGLWPPDSSSEASYRDITFHTLRLGGGRVRKILSMEPTAGFIVEAPTMHGPSTENISLIRHTFDSMALGLVFDEANDLLAPSELRLNLLHKTVVLFPRQSLPPSGPSPYWASPHRV